MVQTSPASRDRAVNQLIQPMVGMPVNVTRSAAASHIIVEKVTSLWESSQLTARPTALGRRRNFQLVFVSTKKQFLHVS